MTRNLPFHILLGSFSLSVFFASLNSSVLAALVVTGSGDFTFNGRGAIPVALPIGGKDVFKFGPALGVGNLGGGDHFIRGEVTSENFGGSGNLILTKLEYRSDVQGPVMETITFSEEYELPPPGGPFPTMGSGFHNIEAFTTFNLNAPPGALQPQKAEIAMVSEHELQVLAPIGLTFTPFPQPNAVPQTIKKGAGLTNGFFTIGMPGISNINPLNEWRIFSGVIIKLEGGLPTLPPPPQGGTPRWIQLDLSKSAENVFAVEGFDLPPSVHTVPEPNSTLSLLALGTLGAASTLNRKLKSSKSTQKKGLG